MLNKLKCWILIIPRVSMPATIGDFYTGCDNILHFAA